MPTSGTLISVFARFLADATVANRVPILRLTTAGGVSLCELPYINTIVATQGINITWGVGVQSLGQSGNRATLALPQYSLTPGDIITTSTNGIDVGDQWSLIACTFAG
jgi:hypothetical protein